MAKKIKRKFLQLDRNQNIIDVQQERVSHLVEGDLRLLTEWFRVVGSAMIGVTFKLVTRMGLP